MKVDFLRVWRAGVLAIVILVIIPIKLVSSEADSSPDNNFTCPNNLKKLTPLLLKDLPDYSNRVIQRTQRANRKAGIRNYIITASQAELEPLNLPRIQYSSIDRQDPKQVFFTVLERQYGNNKVSNIQTYHWLFLTQTSDGWRMVMMFSRFGNSQANNPPTPPMETTDGIIGQGVQLWLRDCRAGTVRA
ncbi:MAG: hypothetical protein QNJ53_08145 [Pleurocapsa sp. MO_192.B19]|nr:hypothetical protein [Pleurocapsa sp. MO_192.B19]